MGRNTERVAGLDDVMQEMQAMLSPRKYHEWWHDTWGLLHDIHHYDNDAVERVMNDYQPEEYRDRETCHRQ